MSTFKGLPPEIVQKKILSMVPQGRVNRKTKDHFDANRRTYDDRHQSPYWRDKLLNTIDNSEDGTIHAGILHAGISEQLPDGITQADGVALLNAAIQKSGIDHNDPEVLITLALLKKIHEIAMHHAGNDDASVETTISRMAQAMIDDCYGPSCIPNEQINIAERSTYAHDLQDIEVEYTQSTNDALSEEGRRITHERNVAHAIIIEAAREIGIPENDINTPRFMDMLAEQLMNFSDIRVADMAE